MAVATVADSPTGQPETLTVEEAARRLGISRSLGYEAARSGELAPGVPVVKVGRRLLVPRRALDRILLVDLVDSVPAIEPIAS